MKAELASSAASVIDIQDLRHGYDQRMYRPLLSESLDVAGEPIDVQIGTVTYHPTTKNPYDGGEDLTGERTMFGVFARSQKSIQLIQLVSGPAQFARYGDYDIELRREQRILEIIAQHPRSRVPLSDFEPTGSIVMPLPRAFQSKEAIYEATAPGRLLRDALTVVAESRALAELSDQEVALLLTQFHTSARLSLARLHDLDIKHHHPHIDNFNVDLRSGATTLFDYTYAVSKNHDDTTIEVDRGRLTADNTQDDVEQFEASWQEALEAVGLEQIGILPNFDAQTMRAAVGKLETAVVRHTLRGLGVSSISDDDVRRILALQEKLIGAAPDIHYPKNTVNRRFRAILATAKVAIKEFLRA